jgi:hypothetical protein
LEQGDDSKRREHSRSRSRERKPPSSEEKGNEEDKEQRERSQSPTEQMQFATNNFEMLLTKQMKVLEGMHQDHLAKQRRK